MIIYEKTIFIPFHLGDPAGILFFGHVFTMAHEAYESFITKKMNLDWSQWFQNSEWIVPVKEAKAEFNRPLFVGKDCMIKVVLKGTTESSISMQYDFIQNDIPCCTVSTVHVFCSKKTGKKQPIPAAVFKLMDNIGQQ